MTPTDVPEESGDTYATAIRQAIDLVFSETFARQVGEYMERALRFDAFVTGDWDGVNRDSSVARIRAVIPGLAITTYGGVRGRWVWEVFGNRAYDGDSAGPIRINRIPYADAGDLTNTIVHEAAHRAGLRHANGNRDCGPPYVLGDIAERQARGVDTVGSCSSFDQPRFGPYRGKSPIVPLR